ncbi:MAG: HAD hydrolase-like protein [Deltaproteobacteria bacterium]|nr:HAD hydrolase-like protein [Deltaproteobacteria bacterium]
MPQQPPLRVTMAALIERHAVLLLDAYGVLITHDGVLPGARELVRHLRAIGKPFYILTNDASTSPQGHAARFAGRGLDIAAERIITAGMLLGPYFAAQDLAGARCAVLGPADSALYVRHAGAVVVDLGQEPDAEVVVVCDEQGYALLETLDAVLSLLLRRLDAGLPVHLVLPNPDLVYPAGPGRYGLTAGAVAVLLEAALAQRYPERQDLRFVPLGKPHAGHFVEALRRSGTRDMVMVGDQPDLDICGATRFGLPSALVTSGLARVAADGSGLERYGPEAQPTYLLGSLLV